MTRKSFDAQGLQFAWDSTSLKLYEECPYKYKLKMLDNWTPRQGKSVHLFFGQEYANALEHYHKHRTAGLPHDQAQRLIVKEALEHTWIDGKPWHSDHNTKTRETLIRSIVWYTEQFADDPCQTYILADGRPAVELSFTLPLDDTIILTGHLDRLVLYNEDLYVQDQKTSGSTINARWFDTWSPDVQMSLYTLAGQVIFHAPVKGVIVDAAQIAVGFTRFERGFIHRSAQDLVEFLESARYYIDQARANTLSGFFPRNTSACGNYGGCEFRHICTRSREVREQFLKGDFHKEWNWDPLEART